ncbi:MAG: hypothetical protein LLG24_07520 [Actinomycetia bacterium]|nr:hypothetical protein [Actinomycetes bacterium]
MRICTFDALWMVSHEEKRGRALEFDERTTVIRGANETGKSALMKSLYYCLGAEPPRLSSRWKTARARILLRFRVDGTVWYMLRAGGRFGLFDGGGDLRGTYASVTTELAPALAQLFDFSVTLVNKENERQTPTPAYMFLPFYVDQDGGWSSNFSSFTHLQQFRAWRRELVDYMVGVYPGEYYSLDWKIRQLEDDQVEPRSKLDALDALRADLGHKFREPDFDVEIGAFATAVDELLARCAELKDWEEKYRDRLQQLEGERLLLKAQLEIVRRVKSELTADFEYSTFELPDGGIACPICGQEYSNSFEERFSIARDEHRCLDLMLEVSEELTSKEREMLQLRTSLGRAVSEYEGIHELLVQKQGDVTLSQLIRKAGRKEVFADLKEQRDALQMTLGQIAADTAKARERKRSLTRAGTEKRELVEADYRERMKQYLQALNVDNLPEERWTSIEAQIEESGSSLPRAALAYTVAMAHLVHMYGDATYFPLVIDSPRQQDQDEPNYRRVLEFLRDRLPDGTQLVLGLVNDLGVDFGGRVIEMTEKNYALSQQQYKPVAGYTAAFEHQLSL